MKAHMLTFKCISTLDKITIIITYYLYSSYPILAYRIFPKNEAYAVLHFRVAATATHKMFCDAHF